MSNLRGPDYALVSICLAFIVYSLLLPANHSLMSPDNVMTFDTWWYANTRLRYEGALPQWNPYSGLGRIAVQWNQVPVSIFTPILAFTELTPTLFNTLNFIAIIFSFIGVYVSARIFGYRSYLPLIAVLLILPGFYNPHSHPFPFATFFLFFPAALAMVIRAIEADEDKFLGWWSPALLVLSLSFVGIRLENLVHALAFLGVVLVCGFGARRGLSHRTYSHRIVAMAALLLLVLAANAWQIAYLFEATLDSGRALQSSKSFASSAIDSWKWTFAHVCRRPEVLIVFANIALLGLFHRRGIQSIGARSRGRIVIFSSRLRRQMALAALLMPMRHIFRNSDTGGRAAVAIVVQFGLVLCISWGVRLLSEVATHTGSVFDGGDMSYSVYGFLSVALVAFVFAAKGKLPITTSLSAVSMGFFAGMYVSEYSDSLGLFMRPIFYVLIPLGAVGAVLAGRGWIVAALYSCSISLERPARSFSTTRLECPGFRRAPPSSKCRCVFFLFLKEYFSLAAASTRHLAVSARKGDRRRAMCWRQLRAPCWCCAFPAMPFGFRCRDCHQFLRMPPMHKSEQPMGGVSRPGLFPIWTGSSDTKFPARTISCRLIPKH